MGPPAHLSSGRNKSQPTIKLDQVAHKSAPISFASSRPNKRNGLKANFARAKNGPKLRWASAMAADGNASGALF